MTADHSAMPNDEAAIAHAYAGYTEQKGWVDPFTYHAEASETYRAEIGTDNLAGLEILEIGFGNGDFLAWARDRGARVAGSEIGQDAVARANAAGVELVSENLAAAATENAGRFDLITAFDVFEHMTLGQLLTALRACAIMLKPGGRLIARFPNGQSPFGLPVQHGDVTHRLILTGAKIAQLLPGSGLAMVAERAAHRVRGTGIATRSWRALRYLGHDLIEGIGNFLYPAPRRIIYAPVVVVELKRENAG